MAVILAVAVSGDSPGFRPRSAAKDCQGSFGLSVMVWRLFEWLEAGLTRPAKTWRRVRRDRYGYLYRCRFSIRLPP